MSQRHTAGGAPPPSSALSAVRRWWPLVLLGVVLGLLAAAVLTRSQEVRYTATTSVLVLATGVDASLTSSRPEVNMDTEAELVRSAQVAEVAKGLLGTSAPAEALREGLEVTVPLNSQVLAITYNDRTASSAQAGAQAFAQGYLSFRADEARRDLTARSNALQADLDAAGQELRLATDKAAALPANSPDRVFAEAQRGILTNRISTLSARLSALGAASPAPGQIITAASLPTAPTTPRPRLNSAAGLVAGLLLGTAFAGIADRVSRRLRDAGDVVRKTGQPVLLEMPSSTGILDLAGAAQTGRFDRLRNTLASGGELPELLQISDPTGRGASAPVAVGMAQSIVRVTGEVTLVLAHAHSPATQWLGLEDRDGLSELLAGAGTLESMLCEVPRLPGVRVLPPGRAPETLDTLLQSREARAVLRRLRSTATVTVVETAGAGTSAGAQTVAAESDAVLLVVERGVTPHRLITSSAEATQQMGSKVMGVVLAPRVPTRAARTMRPEKRPAGLGPASAAHSGTRTPLVRDVERRSAPGPVNAVDPDVVQVSPAPRR